ncbi:MAG: DedA family protein [Deltaproteobacteria bacterium]|nr:DedA family protein [Deltaproteobacteria bacterium]
MHLQDLLTIITNNPHAAYFVILLVSFSESLAFVGLLVPGTMIMFGVGAVVSTGALSLKPTLIAAAIGAVGGDGASYWLGRHYRERLRNLWPFRRHPRMLTGGESFFRRYGAKSAFLGRFVGPLRPVIPIVAGMLDMPPLKFALVNVISAIGWAFAYTMPGVFFRYISGLCRGDQCQAGRACPCCSGRSVGIRVELQEIDHPLGAFRSQVYSSPPGLGPIRYTRSRG